MLMTFPLFLHARLSRRPVQPPPSSDLSRVRSLAAFVVPRASELGPGGSFSPPSEMDGGRQPLLRL